VSSPYATWTTELADSEGLETFTDWQGFVWCISSDGCRAVPRFGPGGNDGRYQWTDARASGHEVDLDRPAYDHKDRFGGPCQFEVFAFLLKREHGSNHAKSTRPLHPNPWKLTR
jgi:hypothetical protein